MIDYFRHFVWFVSDYLIILIKNIYYPHNTFKEIFSNEEDKLTKAITFLIVNIIVSFIILFAGIKFNLIKIANIESLDFIASIFQFLIPSTLLIIVIIPVLGGYLHLFCKLFKGNGNVFSSIIVFMYSYFLAPYATLLYITFRCCENFIEQKVLLDRFPPAIFIKIEIIIEFLLILFGLYVLSKGVQFGHEIEFKKACYITTLFSITTAILGIFLGIFIGYLGIIS